LQDLIKSVAAITDEQAQSLSEASSSVAQLEQASQLDARVSMDTGGTVQRLMERVADLKRAAEVFQMPDNSALGFAKAS
jgi:methyl-accepting chemotaxis protein